MRRHRPAQTPGHLGRESVVAVFHAEHPASAAERIGGKEIDERQKRQVLSAVWAEMVASDPVGSTWGAGVRRAPTVPSWGFNRNVVSKNQTPTLMVSGVHDKQVPQERVREYYADLGAPEKVFVDLACSSHNAMWERNHLLLFQASLEWLEKGTVNGQTAGMLKMGY